ncbi:MAG TPA: hypothetical protein VNO30_35210 [Kofleriaceae bacterium]|nr:hypothetical protein [Kofleriaceae bacterium]
MTRAHDPNSTSGLQRGPAGSGPGATGKQTLTGGLPSPSAPTSSAPGKQGLVAPSGTAPVQMAAAAPEPAPAADPAAAPAQPGAAAPSAVNVSFDLDTSSLTGVEGGFSGTVTVTVTGSAPVATAGGFTLFVGGTEPPTKCSGQLENGQLVKLDGEIPFSVRDTVAFISGRTQGTYNVASKQLSGSATATLVRDQVLGSVGDDQVLLVGGSALTATLAGGMMPAFKGAGGQLTASVRERGREWARAQLSGNYEPGAGGGFTGTAAVTVTGTKQLLTAGGYTLSLAGAGAPAPSTGRFEAGKLVRLDGDIPFSLAPQGGETLITGHVTGAYAAESKQLTGTGTATLVRDQVLGGVGEDQVVLVAGSAMNANLAGSATPVFGGAGGQLTASIRERGQEWARAQLSGNYEPGATGGFTGTATVTVTGTKQLVAVGGHTLSLGGTGAQGPSTGRFEAGKLVQLDGDIPFSLAPQGGELLATGRVNGSYVAASKQLTGTGTATLVRDQALGQVGEDTLVLVAGSTMTANLAGSGMPVFGGAGGQLTASIRERDQEWARAQLSGNYEPGAAAGFTGTATVTVTGTKQLVTVGGYTLSLGGTGAQGPSTGRFEAGKLVQLDGDIPFSFAPQGGEPLATGRVNGTYVAASKQLTGTGTATLVRDQVLGEVGEDKLVLIAGSTMTANLAGSALPVFGGAGGQLTASVRERDQEWARAQISGEYKPGDAGGFTGTATVTVTGTKQLAAIGGHTLSLGGTGAPGPSTGQFEAGKLVRLEGNIPFSLAPQGGEPMVTGHVEGTYVAESKQLTGTGTATLVRDQTLGELGDDKIVLVAGSTMTANLAGNAMPVFSGASGQLTASIRERDQEWATAQISGEYKPGDASGFTGTAGVNVTGTKQLLAVGSYTVALGGGGAQGQSTGRFEAGKLVQLDGKLPFSVSQGAEPFATGLLDGTYVAESKQLTGAGTATLVRDQDLGGVGNDKIVLAAGSTMTATLAGHGPPVFSGASGQLTASIREQGQEWATAQIGGNYEPGAAGGFTGTAGVTVTRQKQVATIGSYTLFIGGADAKGQSTGHFEAGRLTQIDGELPFSVAAGEAGTLATGLLNGTFTVDPATLNGTGRMELARDRDQDLGNGNALRVKQGTGGTIAIQQNQLQQITGSIAAEVLAKGQPEISFTGQGTFDVATSSIVTASGTASLLRTLEPFGEGVVQVEGLSGAASVTNNALEKLSGNATVKLPKLHDSKGQFGITWEKREGKDHISGSGLMDVILVPRENGRGTQGKIAFTFDGTEHFTATGDVAVSLSESIGGTIGMTMDERLDPEINGDMKLKSELVSATQLFNQRLDIMPERSIQAQAGPVPLTLSFGALGGFKLGLDPLLLDASVGISKWKPVSEGSVVPTFDSTARVGWGMDASGLASAWVKLGIGVPGFNAGAGIKGGATIDAPVTPNIELSLHGGREGFWGELGVGISLHPELLFNVTPFLYADLFNFGNDRKRFEHELGGWTWNLGEVAKFDWGKSYQFGDRHEVADRPTVPMVAGPATQTNTVHEVAPEVPATAMTPPAPKPGGPDLSSMGSLLGKDFGGDPSMAQFLERMDQIQKVAEGVAAIAYLGEQIGDLLAAVTVFGPPGLVIGLVWKLLTREITWEKLSTAVRNAIEGIKAIYEILSPYLPAWWQKLTEIINKGINVFDEWWNGDRHMREAIERGEHQYASPEMKGQMINRILDFWIGTEDKHAVLTVLESGDEHTVVSIVGWGKLKDKLTNGADSVQERFSRWCEQRGVGHREWVNGPLFFDHWEWRWTGATP